MTRMLDPRVKVVVLLFVNLLMYSSIAYWGRGTLCLSNHTCTALSTAV